MPKGIYKRTKQSKEWVSKRVEKLIGQHHGGWKLSNETRQKMSIRKKGNKYNLGKKQSIEQINKRTIKLIGKKRNLEYIKSISGKNSHNWIKDRTKLKKSDDKMNDYAYKIWIKQVRIRDGGICRLFNNECNGRL